MGIRVASFKLYQHGTLAANAGLVTELYGNVAATVSCAGREIPTTTVWSGRLVAGDPAASLYSVLRPTAGDWPTGTLNVEARQCSWDLTGATKVSDHVLATEQFTVGPAVDGVPPTCAYVSGPIEIGYASHPGGGTRPPSAGVAVAGVMDSAGPLVSVDVEYTISGNAHVCCAQDIARAHGSVAVALQGPHDAIELKRVRITNVLGKVLEMLPPFPRGTAPGGPIGIKF